MRSDSISIGSWLTINLIRGETSVGCKSCNFPNIKFDFGGRCFKDRFSNGIYNPIPFHLEKVLAPPFPFQKGRAGDGVILFAKRSFASALVGVVEQTDSPG